ncbi:hypothetical protein B0H12DRAFT_1105983 [Mycena haematopus]|nr:hypothetical protein B0H12DRAFT_1105983 [Mycena haematopus]
MGQWWASFEVDRRRSDRHLVKHPINMPFDAALLFSSVPSRRHFLSSPQYKVSPSLGLSRHNIKIIGAAEIG